MTRHDRDPLARARRPGREDRRTARSRWRSLRAARASRRSRSTGPSAAARRCARSPASSDRPIRRHDTITDPDLVVVLEPSLVHEVDVADGLDTTGSCSSTPRSRRPSWPADVRCVPAAASRRHGSGFVNLVMLGAAAAALGEPPLEELQDAAVELLGKKADAAAVRDAVAEGYAWLELSPWQELSGRRHRRRRRSRAAAHRRLAHRRQARGRPLEVRRLPALLALLPRLGDRARRHRVRRLRLRLLQGLRDLRRGLPDGRDRRWWPNDAAQLLTGGEAVAHAMRQIDPDVVPGLPDHAADADHPELREVRRRRQRARASSSNVESEHSAMSAAIGAALAGARTMTATSSQGLALMAEVVYIAASMRAPIVMALGNRALSGPINIHCDHSDSMLIRDSGVVQLFAENAQEAYDLTVLAPRIAEHPDVLLPVLVCLDGFTITHSAEPVELLADDDGRSLRRRVRAPAPRARRRAPDDAGPVRDAGLLLRVPAPAGGRDRGGAAGARRARRRSSSAVRTARTARRGATGSRAPSASIVALGSTAGTVKDVVDELRDEGEAVGLAQDRLVPPLPGRARSATRSPTSRRVIVLDRADSPGGAPPLHAELAAALYGSGSELDGHVYGLGGRDLHPADVRAIFAGAAPTYVGVRGEPCPV